MSEVVEVAEVVEVESIVEAAVEVSPPTSSEVARSKPACRHQAQDPSPEEIATACLEIQAEWSESERARRWGYKVPEWLPPGAERHKSPEESMFAERGWGKSKRRARDLRHRREAVVHGD